MTRNKAREALMQILYELDMNKEIASDTAVSKGTVLIEERISGNHVKRGTALLTQILDDLTVIDDEINGCSTKWKTSRMPKIDLAILRLAAGEIRFSEDVPHAVVINEAINLAKKYSTEQSAKFIHGVLGTISKKYTGDRHE